MHALFTWKICIFNTSTQKISQAFIALHKIETSGLNFCTFTASNTQQCTVLYIISRK